MAASLGLTRFLINLSINRFNYQLRPYCISPEYIMRPKKRLRRRRPARVPHEEYPTFAQRLKEMDTSDPEVTAPVNIGLDPPKRSGGWLDRIQQQKDNMRNEKLEKASRHRTLKVSLDKVKEEWVKEMGPYHIKAVAEHYGVYQDLFGPAYFLPVVELDVLYDYDEELYDYDEDVLYDYDEELDNYYDEGDVLPVHRGNIIPPSMAKTAPHIWYEAEEGALYTLIMTNPDGHLTDNSAEYLHWAIGNIPGCDLEKGQTLVDYLQPFPPRGTGLHRHIFLLFKQEKELDYSAETRPPNCTSLHQRTFSTLDFYRKFEDDLTAIGLAFFQSDWDPTVKHVYHHILDMKEPSYEYDFPPQYHPQKKTYPHKLPFDRYYDEYRDKKDIAEEVLKMKLDMISPYKPYKEFKYPLAFRKKHIPSWLKKREFLKALRLEQFKDLP